MRAVAADAEIARRAEHRLAEQVRRAVNDQPGKIAAGRARERRIRHQSDRRLHVRRVHRGCLDLDQRIVRVRSPKRQLRDARRDRGRVGCLGVEAQARRVHDVAFKRRWRRRDRHGRIT
jgi:hypothetical protein